MGLNQVTNHSICTALAQLAVKVDTSPRGRVTGNLAHITFCIESLVFKCVEYRLRLSRHHRTTTLKTHRSSILQRVVIQSRDALVSGVDTSNSGVRCCLCCLSASASGVR